MLEPLVMLFGRPSRQHFQCSTAHVTLAWRSVMKPMTSSITVVSVLCAIDVAGLAHLACTVFASLNLMLCFIRFVFLCSSTIDGIALRSITSLTLSSL